MIINNLKHSILRLIFSIFACIPGFLGVFVGIVEKEIWLSLVFLLFAGAGLFLLLISILNIQWANIYDDKIVIRNILGIIKEIEYMNIKKAFKINTAIFSIKMLGIHKPCIVLSQYKSLQKSQIEDAYNRKKLKYIILPFSKKNETTIKDKYKLLTGVDLEIK